MEYESDEPDRRTAEEIKAAKRQHHDGQRPERNERLRAGIVSVTVVWAVFCAIVGLSQRSLQVGFALFFAGPALVGTFGLPLLLVVAFILLSQT